MTDRKTQLENCAVWHMAEMDRALAQGNSVKAEHHDMLAFRLFREAHELSRING